MTVRLMNVPRQAVSDAICHFKELDNNGRRLGSVRKRTVSTSKNHKRVERNPKVFMRQIARDMGISDRSPQVSVGRDSFSLMRSSLRFNKFTTPKMIESCMWTLQAPWQLLNIVKIQSRSWSGQELVQVPKHIWFFWKRALKSINKCPGETLLKLLYFRGTKSISEIRIGALQQDSAPVFKAKTAQEWCKANFPDMISSKE
ncbi:uncharacterized protein TNCV_4463251 [Trichonephila clavipes]|nr:uncharacterized protein TNCV_4463251 [Trichonephila clavipes]